MGRMTSHMENKNVWKPPSSLNSRPGVGRVQKHHNPY